MFQMVWSCFGINNTTVHFRNGFFVSAVQTVGGINVSQMFFLANFWVLNINSRDLNATACLGGFADHMHFLVLQLSYPYLTFITSIINASIPLTLLMLLL